MCLNSYGLGCTGFRESCPGVLHKIIINTIDFYSVFISFKEWDPRGDRPQHP